jgi:hypothetical protein
LCSIHLLVPQTKPIGRDLAEATTSLGFGSFKAQKYFS